MNKTCEQLEQEALDAAIAYVIATGQAAGRKIKGDFYTIEINEDKVKERDSAKKDWEDAVRAWKTECLDKKG